MTFGALVRVFRSYGLRPLVFNLILLLGLGFSPQARAEGPLRILAFGDSLTHGYGLDGPDIFPVQLEKALAAKGIAAEVQNAGVSGDTTAGGLARLDWSLGDPAGPPTLVIVELGANDALRGIDPKVTEANLDAILGKLAAQKVGVLLAGMQAPPNLGADYAAAFDPIFARLAEKYQVAFYPFFLDGVAADSKLNQADGMHPNAAGVAVIVERITPFVIQALEQRNPA